MRLLSLGLCMVVASMANGSELSAADEKKLADLVKRREKVEEQMGVLAKTVSEMPADDIKTISATMKILGETVLAEAEKKMQDRAEIEDTLSDVSGQFKQLLKSHTELSTEQQTQLRDVFFRVEAVDKADIYSRQIDAASQVVFSVKKEGAKDMDTNQDGKIDHDELVTQLQQSMKKVSRIEKMKILKEVKPDLTTMMNDFDTNKDGKLSKVEFQGPTKTAESARQFAFLDANSNGELDIDEFFLLAFPEFHPDNKKLADFYANGMYNVQDLDDKGRVSLPGFIKHYVGTQLAGKNCKGDVCTKEEQARYDHIAEEANEEVKEMIKVFRSADLDSDQKLSKETFLKTISALQLTGDIQDVAWKVIALVDDNHDNMLSYDELIDNGKKFGAATEDFFKDVDVLYIEGDETDKGIAGRSAFVKAGVDETKQRRLRGGLV